MFDKLLRDLKRLEQGVSIPITLPLDDDGYLDRQCSAEDCQKVFKVLFEDWRDKVRDEQVFCSICRFEAPSTEWNTPEQAEHIAAVAQAYVHRTVNQAMREDARRFNRRQKPGFITMSLSVKPSAPPLLLPIDAGDIMRQKFSCEVCGTRYAAIGVAFFCPACGHNSATATFDNTVKHVRQMVSKTSHIRAALTASFDVDTAENSVRHTLEDSLGRLVSAFQRVVEVLFGQLPNAGSFKVKKNVFQRLTEGSTLWKDATGNGYEDLLTARELDELKRLFQKRHLVAHRDGIVDREYIDKSGDASYAVGQRLVIREATVLRLAELVAKLVGELRKLV